MCCGVYPYSFRKMFSQGPFEFLGALRNVLLKMVKINETKVKIYKWPSNTLSFNDK